VVCTVMLLIMCECNSKCNQKTCSSAKSSSTLTEECRHHTTGTLECNSCLLATETITVVFLNTPSAYLLCGSAGGLLGAGGGRSKLG
jgi:hypothetical protein